MNNESCDCRRVADYDAVKQPGDYYITPGLLHVMLPAHCFIAIKISRPGEQCQADASWTGPVWNWDGNEERPTITPSIHTHGHWHGFLTAGRLVSC